MYQAIFYILFIWFLFSVAMFTSNLVSNSTTIYGICPKQIYKNTKLNWLGVSLLFLLLLVLMPFYYIFTLFYWLCHVGRNKEVQNLHEI